MSQCMISDSCVWQDIAIAKFRMRLNLRVQDQCGQHWEKFVLKQKGIFFCYILFLCCLFRAIFFLPPLACFRFQCSSEWPRCWPWNFQSKARHGGLPEHRWCLHSSEPHGPESERVSGGKTFIHKPRVLVCWLLQLQGLIWFVVLRWSPT